MRSLFAKIFLWFWAATALVIVIFTAVAWQVLPTQPPWSKDLGDMVGVYGASAAEAYDRGGREALAEFLMRREGETGTPAYLFGPDLTELSEREPAPEVREIAAGAPAGGSVDLVVAKPYLFARRVVTSPGGEPRAFVVVFRPSFPVGPHLVWLQIVAVLLTAGLLCFALARYLTSPLGKLERASRDLAEGDLSARVEARALGRRDEVGSLARGFNRMAERLEALVMAERMLLNDISHELRSPLARLGVALSLARMESGPVLREPLDRIEVEAERLEELIGELLTLARLQSGGLPAGKPVDLTGLMREVVADADFEARAVDRSVKCGELPQCEVTGDGALLRSALENVVRNAVRHTPDGMEVEVDLSINASPAGAFAVVTVRDFGGGVPAADLERIFHPFARVGDARDRDSGGVGLGLAITDRAVRSHGGSVSAANARGGGLLVRIELPLPS